MQYERTTLTLAIPPSVKIPALRVGAWFVGKQSPIHGLAVYHRSGILVARHLNPVQAVRLLRALQDTPECPASDEDLRGWATGGHPRDLAHPVFGWTSDLWPTVQRAIQSRSE